ncbi:YdaS family helix-turn-helix protein [Sphingomonas sp. CFBP 8760]|uniref:YdaS family helix-turn-helix protein n=1 Tax=Sphingomonas sp. CFBP 8760 TaxID=2775282 RepID=UPI00177B50A3|nr:helix-turn-helix domain-containing protein [Sphingomonas sp. CFBP 8760]
MDVNHLLIAQAALKAAVTEAGSQSALARLLGVTQRAVWRWVTEGKPLPAQHVEACERETRVPKEKLRPDLPWDKSSLPSLPSISTIEEVAR